MKYSHASVMGQSVLILLLYYRVYFGDDPVPTMILSQYQKVNIGMQNAYGWDEKYIIYFGKPLWNKLIEDCYVKYLICPSGCID